jgi:hypothetical protein
VRNIGKSASVKLISSARAHLIANLPHILRSIRKIQFRLLLNHGGTSIFCKARKSYTHTYKQITISHNCTTHACTHIKSREKHSADRRQTNHRLLITMRARAGLKLNFRGLSRDIYCRASGKNAIKRRCERINKTREIAHITTAEFCLCAGRRETSQAKNE